MHSYNSYNMNLEISATDCIEEKNEVNLNFQSKLVLENGPVSLPDPSKLIDEWFAAQCETQSRYQ